MKNFKRLSTLFVASMAVFGFSACSSDNEMEPEVPVSVEAKTISFVSSSTKEEDWEYFSFKQGKFVEVPKSKANEDLTWDIAFQRFYVRTNSGESGKGKGGALDSGKKSFDEVTEVPKSGFISDKIASVMAKMSVMVERSVNTAFEIEKHPSWMWFVFQEMRWAHNDNVFIVRLADGESYAKVIMRAYKNDEGTSGHITFDYIYPFK